MKNLTLALLFGLFIFAGKLYAAGPYDGIWSMSYLGASVGYVSTHENNGMLLAVFLPGNNSQWEAYAGARSGDTVDLSTIVSGATAMYSVRFISENQLDANQIYCAPRMPGWRCSFPNGAILQGTKVW